MQMSCISVVNIRAASLSPVWTGRYQLSDQCDSLSLVALIRADGTMRLLSGARLHEVKSWVVLP